MQLQFGLLAEHGVPPPSPRLAETKSPPAAGARGLQASVLVDNEHRDDLFDCRAPKQTRIDRVIVDSASIPPSIAR